MSAIITTNYGGRQPNTTAYIKQFFTASNVISGAADWIYTLINNIQYITPTDKKVDVYIKNNLLVNGSINNSSDIRLKENISVLNDEECNKILNIKPIKYCFKDDENKNIHFGLSAQELEMYYPELVKDGIQLDDKENTETNTYKSVNYLELIPILIVKIQNLQNKIDILEDKLKNCST
jgi:hypothetical protein